MPEKIKEVAKPTGPLTYTSPSGADVFPAIPGKRIPHARFRWKGTQLQQAFSDARGGSRTYWVNIPTVRADASDVE